MKDKHKRKTLKWRLPGIREHVRQNIASGKVESSKNIHRIRKVRRNAGNTEVCKFFVKLQLHRTLERNQTKISTTYCQARSQVLTLGRIHFCGALPRPVATGLHAALPWWQNVLLLTSSIQTFADVHHCAFCLFVWQGLQMCSNHVSKCCVLIRITISAIFSIGRYFGNNFFVAVQHFRNSDLQYIFKNNGYQSYNFSTTC